MEKKTKVTTNNKSKCVRLNRNSMMDIAALGSEKPSALKAFMFISQNMDANNALCVSMKELEKALELSKSTLNRAIKYLEENKWLVIHKLGTSNVYTINPYIAWK